MQLYQIATGELNDEYSQKHHPLVELAREAIAAYVGGRKRTAPPENFSAEMQQRAGAFVSLHLKNGDLRGCIGTIDPQHNTLAEEIIDNAISAATRDPRFPPVRRDELDQLDISVDVLTPPEPIDSIHDQDPKQHGLIVQSMRTVVEARLASARPRRHRYCRETIILHARAQSKHYRPERAGAVVSLSGQTISLTVN